jgi:hypothetical protein
MRLKPLAARIAMFTLLAASAAHAADGSRAQRSTSSAQRGTVSAAAAAPRPVPQPPQNYERTPASQERRATAATSAPTSVQVRDKPAYQFTQVAPRSLW